MSEDAGRVQDQGRSHHRKGQPSAATTSLLATYQQAMRDELSEVLGEIVGKAPEPGLGLMNTERVRPPIADRIRLWDLAIKLGRELGAEVDVAPAPDTAPAARRRRSRVDYG